MDVQPQKKLLKLRTFAQDVERARQKSGLPASTEVTEVKKAEAPKAAAPSALPIPAVAEPKKVEAPAPEAHIPAFHELQKKTAASSSHKGPHINASTPKKAPAPKRTVSVRAKKPDLKTVKNVGGGTIITDSKAGGFKLIPSILKSIDDWVKEIKKSFKKKAAPKYVITDTERRRGVIQKATSKTGSIFTADSETLKEEIRRRQATAGASDDIDINWSPNTEAGYALLESSNAKPVTTNVTVAFKKQSVPVAAPAPAPVPPPVIETPMVPPPVKVAPVVPRPVVPPPVFVEPTVIPEIVPEPDPFVPEPKPETIPEPIPVIPEPKPVEVPEPEAEEVPIIKQEDEYQLTTPEEHYKIRSLGDITRINTNILSIGIIGAIAGLVIFIILVRALLGFIIPDGARIVVAPPVPLSERTVATDVPIETISTQAILTKIQETSNAGEATELRFVDADGQPIDPGSILPFLGFDAHPNLNSVIDDVRVVIRGQDRGIIISVTDTTTALGSLLSWEKSMVSDLADTLSLNTTGSGSFSDMTFGLTDARVFTTDTAMQQLTYGFIDENTVAITSSATFFTTLLSSN